jgi:hypothetical protein
MIILWSRLAPDAGIRYANCRVMSLSFQLWMFRFAFGETEPRLPDEGNAYGGEASPGHPELQACSAFGHVRCS